MSLMDKLNKRLFNKLNKNSCLHPKEQRKAILKLAQTKGGTVTVSEIVLGTSLSLEEAEEILQYFTAKGYANMRLSDAGAIVYEFPGIRTTAQAVKTDTPAGRSSSVPQQTSSPQPAAGKALQSRARPNADDVFKTSRRKTAHLPDWMKKRKKNS